MLKYIIVIVLALIIAQGVYVGYYAIHTIEHVKAMQQNVKEMYDYNDTHFPVKRWES